MTISAKTICVGVTFGLLPLTAPAATFAAELAEPPVLASADHLLDILMVARPARISSLTPFHPTGWVYDICPRPKNRAMNCPPSRTNLYGGTRLQLQQGDTLKVRLVNRLPLDTGAKHAADPGLGYLTLNPTNLHTHGMLVSAHYPSLTNRTYGDNVFVLTLNSANGRPDPDSHVHGDVRFDFTDYEIKIPASHPSGLFWFHPHAHGVALNQISAGMAGIITIGDPRDYLCAGPACRRLADIPVRHMILKDTQILPGGAGLLLDQQNPTFCPATAAPEEPPRRGFCLSQIGVGSPPVSGHWFFTVNGQQYPTVPVSAPQGEIWRITNASASVAYNLQLFNPAQKRNMLVQLLSIDGVSVSPEPGTSQRQLAQAGGTKFDPAVCPGAAHAGGLGTLPEPICARRIVMFPSSRVELWVDYRNAADAIAAPPAGANAVLRMAGMETGPGGDAWPQVDLARIEFSRSGPSAGAPPLLAVNGDGRALLHPAALAADLAEPGKAFAAEADCKPLAHGHKRRIFFNSLPPPPAYRRLDEEGPELPFGLGYEEIDEKGRPVAGTFQDVSVFDPAKPTVCVTLGPGNTPVSEQWQLVNLASEDHNFHMHQSKFRLLSKDEIDGTLTPGDILGKGILHDNVPVRHADGICNSVADWRQHKCTAHPTTIEIPFTVAGDYVYHCHILEHEDGGMMARIRVRTAH